MGTYEEILEGFQNFFVCSHAIPPFPIEIYYIVFHTMFQHFCEFCFLLLYGIHVNISISQYIVLNTR